MKKKFIYAGLLALASSNLAMATSNIPNNNYHVDRFADIEVLRYDVPGFDQLTLQQKKLVYFLSQAALYGREILAEQNVKYNLQIRKTLELIYTNPQTDKNTKEFKALETYLKQIWFANGIHHHYSSDKFTPKFSQEYFVTEVKKLKQSQLPIPPKSTLKEFLDVINPVIFDPKVMPKAVAQASGVDLILNSSSNLYDGVTQKEVEDYYNDIKKNDGPTPVSHGLNSRVTKKNGKIVEERYKLGGLYSDAIEKILFWLEKAEDVADTPEQKNYIAKLRAYYTTGDLKTFDEYSILWTEDTKSEIDFINGFIESYGDPLGMTGSWESIVNFKNHKASERTEIISNNAQWFEDNSPVDKRFKKEEVKGVSAKVITACILAGDAYPATPIGINLPNSNWIRASHGSKSVTIENITDAYDKASMGNGFNDEFVLGQNEKDLMAKYLFITDNLHTDLHECLGHGSGKLLPGVDPDAMKAYGATLEETRADLFALYYLADPKLVELGLLENEDAYKAEYYKYILNGLMTQLMRIEPGKDVEESHMRNRKLIAEWVYENGKSDNVIEYVKKNGKTFIKVNDYRKLQYLFGKLLSEVQRIKSEGDYEAGKALVEQYAVKVDPAIHNEVLARYATLDIAPYKGFVNPIYTPVMDKNGNIQDVKLNFTEGYTTQMLRYSKDYSPLTK